MEFNYKDQIDAILKASNTSGISNDEVNYALFNLKVAIAELNESVSKLAVEAKKIQEASWVKQKKNKHTINFFMIYVM